MQLGAAHDSAITHDQAITMNINLTGIPLVIDTIALYDRVDTTHFGVTFQGDFPVGVRVNTVRHRERRLLAVIDRWPDAQPGRLGQAGGLPRRNFCDGEPWNRRLCIAAAGLCCRHAA